MEKNNFKIATCHIQTRCPQYEKTDFDINFTDF